MISREEQSRAEQSKAAALPRWWCVTVIVACVVCGVCVCCAVI